MAKSGWRGFLAITMITGTLMALTVSPAAAYETNGPDYEWATGNGSGGDDYVVKVCLYSDFDGPNGDFDTGVARIARIQDAITRVNDLNTELRYEPTNTACANLGSGQWWLGIGWAESYADTHDNAAAFFRPLTHKGFPCITHCMKTAEILFDSDDNQYQDCTSDLQECNNPVFDTNWYVSASLTYSGTSNPDVIKWALEQVAYHEFGHAGLAHEPDVQNAIMCAGNGACAVSNGGWYAEDKIAGINETETQRAYYRTDDINGFNAIY